MLEWKREVTEVDKQLLAQAIAATTIIPPDFDFHQGDVKEVMGDLPHSRRCLNYLQTKPELHLCLKRMLQYLLNVSIPVTAPDKLYFKVLDMSIEDQVHFFNFFFSYYERKLIEHTSSEFDKTKYAEFYSSPTAEVEIWLLLFGELDMVCRDKEERIAIYRRILEMKCDFSGQDLTEVLKDLIRLDEYELFVTYVTTFNQTEYLKYDETTYKKTALNVACSVHSLNVLKYLIETVGMDYDLVKSPIDRYPIVIATSINDEDDRNNKSHHQQNAIEIEYKKQQSLKVVQYLVEVYKRHNRSEELLKKFHSSQLSNSPNYIVRVAYRNGNIPVLLYLKELGFNISESFVFLCSAVDSSCIEAVRLFWSEYRVKNPDSHPDDEFRDNAAYNYFVEAIYNASMLNTFDILNVFEEFGIDLNNCPNILGAARFELLNRYDFDHVLNCENRYIYDPHFELIIENLISSKYFTLEYLLALFARYPSFKSNFETNFLSELTCNFKGHLRPRFEMKLRILRMVRATSELYPEFRIPFMTYWISTFNSSSCNTLSFDYSC